MSRSGIVTLLSDFGMSDVYVGVMKGAIASINPALTVIDLTHEISPQDILQARFALMTAFAYFPVGTVHVAVVDPGVGSERRGIAVAVGDNLAYPTGFLVGPDNGLFSGIWQHYPVLASVELTHPRYWRTQNPSQTFHGRDIFAPVGAHLASGVPLTALGADLAPDSLVTLELPTPTIAPQKIEGCIQASDRFGNLITNIPATAIPAKQWYAQLGDMQLAGQHTYSDRPIGAALALIGSHGWVEIAVNQGNAAQFFHLKPGAPVTITW